MTKEVYAEYAFIRRSTLSRLRWANPEIEPRLILACDQKLLDRILFIAFCEDRGLLPAETIKRAYKHRDPYNPRPLWENFRGMFRAINVGSDELDIRKYNGGLFADDPVLDNLKMPDEIFGLFDSLAEYDFRPASAIPEDEVIADRRLVNVEILGHIFEQSIDDLEKLQAELEKPVEIPAEPEPEPIRRRSAVASARGRSTRPTPSPATSSSRHWAASCTTGSSGSAAITPRGPGGRPGASWPTRGPTTSTRSRRRSGRRCWNSGRTGSMCWARSGSSTRPAAAAPS